jgi:dephospho-CoA kinase
MSHERKMVIGVAGPIGAGKTTVSRIFEEFGALYISADELGWEALDEVKKELAAHFGEVIMKRDRVDRQKLGEIVFSKKSHLKELNDLTHPRLIQKIRSSIERTDADTIVLDAALLFEWPRVLELVDYPILVLADKNLRKNRSIRKGMVSRRFELISQQQGDMSGSEKRARFIIRNNGTIDHLRKQCRMIYEEIKDDS